MSTAMDVSLCILNNVFSKNTCPLLTVRPTRTYVGRMVLNLSTISQIGDRGLPNPVEMGCLGVETGYSSLLSDRREVYGKSYYSYVSPGNKFGSQKNFPRYPGVIPYIGLFVQAV